MSSTAARRGRLAPEVNRILYVRNLPFKITAEELYDIFGKYGALRQIRVGATPEARGTAFVVYEDIWDAKTACDHLSGFNVGGRYLVVLYYQVSKHMKGADAKRQQEELEHLRARVAAGDAAAAAAAAAGAAAADAPEDTGDSVDDEEDKRLMRR